MSTFNPDDFLASEINAANSTNRVPCPEGDYVATVKSIAARTWQSKKDPGLSGVSLDVTWIIDDQNAKDVTGLNEVQVRQGIMLDMTEDGQLDTGNGKNISLGRLRDAVDLNKPGFTFLKLQGQTARVKVNHRIDGDRIFDEIKAVFHL